MGNNFDDIDILVIEDDPDDSELTMQALRTANNRVRVIHLRDGVEALKYILKREPFQNQEILNRLKLILLNFNLPKLNGLEVLKKIRENELTVSTPVVMLSSYNRESTIAEAYKMGANSYVVKPTNFDNYMTTVSSLVFYWSVINERPTTIMI
jgi:DNA-binding response OmpR family regulator